MRHPDTYSLPELFGIFNDYGHMLDLMTRLDLCPAPETMKGRRSFFESMSKRLIVRSDVYLSNPVPWVLGCGVYKYSNELRSTPVALYENEPAFLDAARAKCRDTAAWIGAHIDLGWSVSYIAAEARVSPDAVAAAMALLDIAPRKRGYKPETFPTAETTFPTAYTAEQYAEIAQMHRTGWTNQQIGIKFGVLGETIADIIAQRAPTTVRRSSRAHTEFYNEKHDEWKRQAEDELNDATRLAEVWGVTYAGARARLVRLGLDTQAMRDDQRDKWRLDLERCGSVYAAAKFWNIAYPSAAYRARRVGWKGTKHAST